MYGPTPSSPKRTLPIPPMSTDFIISLGLKPTFMVALNGTAEAVPFQNFLLNHALQDSCHRDLSA